MNKWILRLLGCFIGSAVGELIVMLLFKLDFNRFEIIKVVTTTISLYVSYAVIGFIKSKKEKHNAKGR